MKRERDVAGMEEGSARVCSSSSSQPCQRRIVSGREHGFPNHTSVIEEIEDVYEYQTILLRFPCFDFFRNVHLCEVASDNLDESSSTHAAPASSSSRARREMSFAPEALQFLPNTLETDAPIAVLNRGTASEMIFEGQWCEAVGDGTAVSNRAVVHLTSETAEPSAQTSDMPSSAAVSVSASSASPVLETPSPVASLLPHAVAGVTADEERYARTEQLRGWVYDRVDVPSAVLVMQRVR